jgi:tetratricopeptide (TPR) repeat protein
VNQRSATKTRRRLVWTGVLHEAASDLRRPAPMLSSPSHPMDQPKALRAAAEAFDLCQEARLPEAEQRYREALADADPRHFRTPDIHSQYAALLTRLNRATEAGRHYERALQLELQNEPDEAHPAVVVSRYVLGEHYLRMGEAESARRVVAPSLVAAQKPLAWLVEAEALFLCGSIEDARAAGERALVLAADAEQRERMRARLSALWPESESVS